MPHLATTPIFDPAAASLTEVLVGNAKPSRREFGTGGGALLHVRTLGELRLEAAEGAPPPLRRKPLALLEHPDVGAEPVTEVVPRPRHQVWQGRVGNAIAGVAMVALALVIGSQTGLFRVAPRPTAAGGAPNDTPVVAIGRITTYPEAGVADLSKPLIDMLATNLGRVAGMRVVSTARMYELAGQSGGKRDTSAAGVVDAARRAGATELVDGALSTLVGGGMRLELRRVELATGSLRKTHSVNGATLFELADSGTARLAADFGALGPSGSVSDVTTRSLAAYRLYEAGLRAFYEDDRASAQRLFDAALVEDSTFAMAAYYAAMTRRANSR